MGSKFTLATAEDDILGHSRYNLESTLVLVNSPTLNVCVPKLYIQLRLPASASIYYARESALIFP